MQELLEERNNRIKQLEQEIQLLHTVKKIRDSKGIFTFPKLINIVPVENVYKQLSQ